MLADYGRVKRALRTLNLEESLIHLWNYSRLVSDNVPLPPVYRHADRRGVAQNLTRFVFPHELELLARELLLHADRSERKAHRSIGDWYVLAESMNAIKGYANDVFDANKSGGVMLTLHRLAHQQFPRFSIITASKIGRYLALYRHQALSEVFERRIGVDVDSYFVMAFATIAATTQRPITNTQTDYSVLGIEDSTSRLFFSRIVGGIDEVRKKLIEDQRLGDTWEYTFNALHYKPLIAFNPLHPERAICPVPPLLERRLTDGIFFDLYESGSGFEKAYGDAVENIVGRMLASLPPSFDTYKPDPLTIGKSSFAGCDWIVAEHESYAFVECKAKRIASKARVADRLKDLQDELRYLADAVVQNYLNLHRWASHDPKIAKKKGPSYCIVVTLEDWLLFSPIATETLEKLVSVGLEKHGISEELATKSPYLVMGSESFQKAVAALRVHPMSDVFGGLDLPKYKGWLPSTYLHDRYPDIESDDVGAFCTEFQGLLDCVMASAEVREKR